MEEQNIDSLNSDTINDNSVDEKIINNSNLKINLLIAVLVAVVIFSIFILFFLNNNKPLKEGVVQQNKALSIQQDNEPTPEIKKDLLLGQESKLDNGCAGWYATEDYRGKNKLTESSDIENILNNKDYLLFDDGNISFYCPADWGVESDEYNGIKQYKIKYLEYSNLNLNTVSVDSFKNDYQMCLSRCFDDADADSPYSWKAKYCSEDYTEENLEKLLSEGYINYISTGALPPGGAGFFTYSKVLNDVVVSASYSSENFLDYPKAKNIREGKSLNELSEEEKNKIITDEIEYYNQEFYKIVKSLTLKNKLTKIRKSDLNCENENLKKFSQELNQNINLQKNLTRDINLKYILTCFEKELFNFDSLLDINGDGTKEIVIKKKSDRYGGNIYDIAIMQLTSNSIYGFVNFFYNQNREDGGIRDYVDVKIEKESSINEIFNDFNKDNVFEFLIGTENIYVYQDADYVRVNDTRNNIINCSKETFPECIWNKSMFRVSPNKEKVAWILEDIYSEGGSAIIIYDYNQKRFNDYYTGEKSAYSHAMEFLEWGPKGNNLVFVQKACVIPGCAYHIRKLDIEHGKIFNYEAIEDDSFIDSDDVEDEEVLKKAKEYIVNE